MNEFRELRRTARDAERLAGGHRAVSDREALEAERAARRRAEEALLLTRFAIDNAVESMFTLSPRGAILDTNATAERRYGYPRAELLGMTLDGLASDMRAEGFYAVWSRLPSAGTLVYETIHRDCAGREFPVELSLARFEVGESEFGCVSVRDLTERNRALAAQGESERRLRAFLEYLPAGVNMKDRDGRYILMNPELESWFDLAPGQSNGRTCSEAFGPDVAGPYVRADRRVLETGKVVRWEQLVRSRSGAERNLAMTKFPVFDSTGQVGAVGTIGIDMTRVKRIEQALRESEERFDLAVRGSSDGLWDRPELSREELWWSPRVYELLGFDPDEYAPTLSKLVGLMHPDDRASFFEMCDRHFTERVPLNIEYRLRTGSGEYRWFRVRGQALWDETGKPQRISGSMQDITELKLGEERRIAAVRAQRDALIREVHHRIKNHLQGIVGLLAQSALRDPQAEEAIDRVRMQVNSIAVVHGLQGRASDGAPGLGAMVNAILQTARGVHSHVFVPDLDRSALAGLALSDDEAVPVALILNEIVTNAIKHCDSTRVDGRAVRVTPFAQDERVGVRVMSIGGALPEGFDFEAGTGLGTGLNLVRALLPSEGVHIDFESTDTGVTVSMALCSPVVFGRHDAIRGSVREHGVAPQGVEVR